MQVETSVRQVPTGLAVGTLIEPWYGDQYFKPCYQRINQTGMTWGNTSLFPYLSGRHFGGNISLIPLRAISMSIPDMYIHLPNTSQRSALHPWYPDQADMKFLKRVNTSTSWYEVFEKSQYQYQLVCSKVDTHPTLVENLNPFWSRLSTDGRDWRQTW